MFKGFFKPLSKRDARIAAVLFGAGFLYMLFTIIKDVLSGMSFDELHSEILILAFIGIVEWGMVTISFSKDKKEDEGPEAAGQIEGSEELPAEENEYRDSEENYGSDDPDDSDADGGDSGEGGAEG